MSTAEFGNILDQQNQFLKQLALKLTKHLDDAEDLIQDTYFKALKNQDKYEQGTNLKGWLYTIMRNTFINNYRKKKVQNTFVNLMGNFLSTRGVGHALVSRVGRGRPTLLD